ncbi:hypothetical protein BVH03_22185 [Pseudomonas sp. PA15(2017)]|uniref:hypothetical protein n=1 Tax=Pseudomonas sp. PA15(2017) TaxID=1932111 RepID=UPI000965E72F|nr:hypothetical protein [Pseudomonas sp. PA15(2017)]OLU22961.1 hypothetical protein BVH03_22185 [Pseudomonas sp. PA15(2017)]
MKPDEFIQQHAPDGVLTAEQAAQLIELAEQGDTGAVSSEEGSAPVVAPEAAAAPEAVAAADDVPKPNEPVAATQDEVDPANAVILAKDNKHTIPYDRLVEAREGRQAAEGKAQEALQKLQEAEKELSALREQAQQRADVGAAPTDADKNLAVAEAAIEAGIDPEIFGDFSPEEMAKGVQKLIATSVPTLIAQALQQQLAPLQQKQATTEHEAHLALIHAKHPDLDSILESTELQAWIDSQPSFARPGYQAVIGTGSAEQVIEFLDTYKAATGKAQAAAAPSAESVKEAAKKAIAAAKPQVPASLSDIPGGKVGPATGHEALATLGATDMAEALMDKSPEQIEAFLNRSV